MKLINIVGLCVLVGLSGCRYFDRGAQEGKALAGTETALVGVYVDKEGYPHPTVEQVSVHPGQKIIFGGPEKFDIVFKDQRSPTGRLEIASVGGIVTIEIPKDILERENRAKIADGKNTKDLVYRYGIRVNGKLTDPTIHISPRIE